ncbi:neuronal acetylcholine receptor subunit alpha-7 [Drosophila nasuta]|uniref:neuronal acetylcholine receptor subunit alpha-7 n=1 Tax=Drosophila nasuta TaxID=42062 RepID=UPI00295E9D7F|nr:neuronal acetylcholine receptor subunit alpha-7 [Drosophila nasuta]
MKNAQLKLSEVDDDELWLWQQHQQHQQQQQQLSFRLAHNSNKSKQLTQQQLKSLSTKHHSIGNGNNNTTSGATRRRASQHVVSVSSDNGQQHVQRDSQQQQQTELDNNMLNQGEAGSNQATQTNIRLCVRKRQRLRRRRKRKPTTAATAITFSNSNSNQSTTTTETATATATTTAAATAATSRTTATSTTYWLARSNENSLNIFYGIWSVSVGIVLHMLLTALRLWKLQLQQQRQVATVLRVIANSITTAIISYANAIALQLHCCKPSSNSSNSNSSRYSSSNSNNSSSYSSSTQIINGLNKHSWIFLLIYLNLSARVCLAGYHEKRLLHDLLDPYNTLERPVLNESDPLQLSFGLTLMQIIDVDEKNQLLVTNVWLKLEWNDMNLRWNTSDYGGVKDLRIPPHRIWKPDVLMYNSADEGFDGTYQTNVVVRNNGSCLYVPPGIFKSTCKIDITWFPFDDQRCEMKFGSWTYDGFQLDLQLQDETGGDISSYVLNGEWELLGVPGKRNEIYYNCCPEPYIDITFAIIIRRRTLYYFFNLIIPCVLIASMALLGFTLPPDSGEKLSLGVTILLSLTVFLNMVAETMPATSDAVPLLGTYFNCIMFMVASSVVSTILILNYHHRNADTHEMSEWIRIVFLCWLPWILRMSRPGRPLILEFPTTPCSDTSSERKHQILSDVELKERSSKSLLANVLDIDDDFRHNCRPMTPGGTLPHNPAFYRTVYGQGDDGSIGPIGSTRMPDAVTHHTCIKSSTEYELGLILKEIRFITDQLRKDDEDNDIANDWKFAAMVVDRLCLIIFTMFTILATIAVLLSAPHIIVS